MIGSQYLLFLCLGIAMLWFQNAMFAAVLTPILLAATTVVSILDDV